MNIKDRISQIMRLLDRAEVVLDMVHDDLIEKRKKKSDDEAVKARVREVLNSVRDRRAEEASRVDPEFESILSERFWDLCEVGPSGRAKESSS